MARPQRHVLLAAVAAVILLVVGRPGPAAARRIHYRCYDGDPACDADATTDGQCTFELSLCGPGLTLCSYLTVPVRVHKRQVVRGAPLDKFGRLAKYFLRCRAPLPAR